MLRHLTATFGCHVRYDVNQAQSVDVMLNELLSRRLLGHNIEIFLPVLMLQ
jgi:hypothetical protein